MTPSLGLALGFSALSALTLIACAVVLAVRLAFEWIAEVRGPWKATDTMLEDEG